MLKRFIAYYRPHRVMFALDMAASLLVALIGVVYPMITPVDDLHPLEVGIAGLFHLIERLLTVGDAFGAFLLASLRPGTLSTPGDARRNIARSRR